MWFRLRSQWAEHSHRRRVVESQRCNCIFAATLLATGAFGHRFKDTNSTFSTPKLACMSGDRNSQRDRHGRGLRGVLVRAPFRGRRAPTGLVEIVAGTVEYLKAEFPNDFAKLQWRVTDQGPIDVVDGVEKVRRWSNDPSTMTIHIYRLPIERLGHVRRQDALHERMHIEEYVFSAAADLIGRDPFDLLPGGGR